jgi:2-phospho-L-lactate/phosphoenolpyruvate guanylyltransferase
MLDVVVPLKRLKDVKSRLAGVLTLDCRQSLMRGMARDVIRQLTRHPDVAKVHVLAGSGWSSSDFNESSLQWWPDPDGVDLNDSLKRFLQARNWREQVLICHGDLPCLTPMLIGSLVLALEENRVVVCPDQYGMGTNILGFWTTHQPRFSFGEQSFQRYCREAIRLDYPWAVFGPTSLTQDVDTAEDLKRLLWVMDSGLPLGAETAACLRRISKVCRGKVGDFEKFAAGVM